MGVIRDNNPAVYDKLNIQADQVKNEAIHSAEMATVAAADAMKKHIWIVGLVIAAVALVFAFILSGSGHTVWSIIFFIGGIVVAIMYIKGGLEGLGAFNRRNSDFVNKINNYR